MSVANACMAELENRDDDDQVTVYLITQPFQSNQRTMVWGVAADVKRVSADGLTAALVITESDGRVQIVPESRVERIEIGEAE